MTQRVKAGGNRILEVDHPDIKGAKAFVGFDRKARWCGHYHAILEGPDSVAECLQYKNGLKRKPKVIKKDAVPTRSTRRSRN